MPWTNKAKTSTTQRGYGAAHRRKRAELLPSAYGQPCSRCGQLMREGQALHLDHADHDRSVYLGFSHASCNVKAGARKGARTVNSRRKQQPTTSRPATAANW